MKAREVRERLANPAKCEPEVLYVLESLAEQLSVTKQQMLMQAQMLDQQLDQMNNVLQVAGNMKSALDQMRSINGDEGTDPTTIEGH